MENDGEKSIFYFIVFFFCRGVKAVEKKDGEGAHNWGSPTENPEDIPAVE